MSMDSVQTNGECGVMRTGHGCVGTVNGSIGEEADKTHSDDKAHNSKD